MPPAQLIGAAECRTSSLSGGDGAPRPGRGTPNVTSGDYGEGARTAAWPRSVGGKAQSEGRRIDGRLSRHRRRCLIEGAGAAAQESQRGLTWAGWYGGGVCGSAAVGTGLENRMAEDRRRHATAAARPGARVPMASPHICQEGYGAFHSRSKSWRPAVFEGRGH